MNTQTSKGLSCLTLLFLVAGLFGPSHVRGQDSSAFRPPAVPLVTHDPYFSVWSMSDSLTDEWSEHWTGTTHAMAGLVRIDGEVYRFMGPSPDSVAALEQVALELWPTRTIYRFEGGGVELTLTFLTPTIPTDLDLLSRPVTYLVWDVRASDGQAHDVSIYFDATAEWAVNTRSQEVSWARYRAGDLSVMRIGTQEQPVLAKSGDNLRIDWGHFYLAVPEVQGQHTALGQASAARAAFVEGKEWPARDDMDMPRALDIPGWQDNMPVMATAFDLGRVGADPVSRHVLLAYDQVFAIEYFNRKLPPYWRRDGMDAGRLLQVAGEEYDALAVRAQNFDEELVADLTDVGGKAYADIAVLAFRQTLAAHMLVADYDGTPYYFSKENFSNGSIATVDVTYPSAPFFLLLSPPLLEAMIEPVMDYAESARWRFPFAPHDLGRYPLANGQRYGGGETSVENQMPVEESGNMLIMTAALAEAEGSARLAEQHAELLSDWAAYLLEKGMDPENQLSTDDFTGHLAHNTNLSLKAIMGLGSYAKLCEMLGKPERAQTYRQAAERMAEQWTEIADDGDHYRLAFDKPGTWSQKYNLVWDEILDLRLFPAEVAQKEIAFYKTKLNEYGLPLDNRADFTKLDWEVWTASLAQSQEDFNLFIEPIHRFLNNTPDRVPMTDWYWTHNAEQRGFQARSVVGGVYVKMLTDPEIWEKWRTRASATASGDLETDEGE